MQFLRTLFWVVIAVVSVIFSIRNWIAVQITLWGGLTADVKLPILLFFAFLIGFAPTFLLHRATRWRLRRKLDNSQKALEEARALHTPSVSTMSSSSLSETADPAPAGVSPIGPL